MSEAANLYIELLKKCVANFIYDDDLDTYRGKFEVDAGTGLFRSIEGATVDPALKREGLIWPSRAHTMIGLPRLDNIRYCVEEILRDKVPGDLIETGVWRGGATIFMRGILKAYGVADRNVWVADSFEGLPPGNPSLYPKESTGEFHKFPVLAVSLDEVRKNFERYGLLDGQVKFLKGWFRDTLPTAPIEKLAVARLDGDLYESTMDALVHLYPKLSRGGFLIIDDYNAVPACNAAVHDFREENSVSETISKISTIGAFWRKETSSLPRADAEPNNRDR